MPFAIWITGPPSAGKSTLTRAVVNRLRKRRIRVQVLESDELRLVLTPNPDYSPVERRNFYRAMSYIGSLLVQNGISVIFDATAHREEYREYARRLIQHLLIVYVTCSLRTRKMRDSKGLYKGAKKGRVKTLPGLQVPYEPPRRPNLTINTDRSTPQEGARRILKALEREIHS